MTHREKVAHLVSELRAKGVNQSIVAPPVFRLLWAVGIQIPPPLFIPFLPLALFLAVAWGIPFGVFMWAVTRLHIRDLLLPCAIGSAFFGLVAAAWNRWKAKKLKLPDWKHYEISN
jgi:hypothetical protein